MDASLASDARNLHITSVFNESTFFSIAGGRFLTRADEPFWGSMKSVLLAIFRRWVFTASIALATCLPGRAETISGPNATPLPPDGTAASASIEHAPDARLPDPCTLDGRIASPSRPTWTGGAAISECGQLQTDLGLLLQPMDGNVSLWMVPSNIRYGLTPRIELRWGLPTHLEQRGGSTGRLQGVSDQTFGFQYSFLEQKKLVPALAIGYGVKIPTANPGKGFGTGFTDHQMVLIASRDVKRVHFDFNAAGTVAGREGNHSGAVQLGLALSVPLSRRFTCVMDNYGGSQPGTSDRLGAALLGGTWSLRPWLVLDGAYTRIYAGGEPRQLFTLGITHSTRLGILPIRKGSMLARILGR